MSLLYAVCPPKLSSSSWAVSAILYHWQSRDSAGASDCVNVRPCVSSSHFADLKASDSTPGGFVMVMQSHPKNKYQIKMAFSLCRALRSYGMMSEISIRTTFDLLFCLVLEKFHTWGVFQPRRVWGCEGTGGGLPHPCNQSIESATYGYR